MRFYLYIAVAVAGLILIVSDPEQRAVSYIAALYETLPDMFRKLQAAMR
jgi:hypothetical protein